MYLAVIEKKLSKKKFGLTEIKKYRFSEEVDASEFLRDIRTIDKKIIYTHLEEVKD